MKRAHELAALGCICLTIDLRGHARHRAQRMEVTPEDNLQDVLAGLDTLRSRPVVQQGQAVRLVTSGNGFSVSAEGKAIGNASDGQIVQVRTPSGSVVSGTARSGGMVEERLLRLLAHLPDGVNEIYLHPATERTPPLVAAMPGYRQREEFAALLSRSLNARVAELGLRLGGYSDFAAGR